MAIEIRSYLPEMEAEWNGFVEKADNSNFLFNRSFMEYHKDRFTDASVLVYDDNVLVAIFPANKKDATVYSHQGLTYGGLVLSDRRNERKLLAYYHALVKFFNEQGAGEMVYKPMPNYLSKTIHDFEHFVMNMFKAELIKVDTSFVMSARDELKIQERRRRSVKKGIKSNTEVRFDNDFVGFWNNILSPNLLEKFNTKPVHSLAEISLLHAAFPEKITQVNAYVDNHAVAGATLFHFGTCVHCQYISSNDFGRESGALDFLFDRLIEHYRGKTEYFSLGTANNSGNDLNLGLCEWKEGWGARIWAHFHYKFATQNYSQLERFIF